jgi:hypothetical protein
VNGGRRRPADAREEEEAHRRTGGRRKREGILGKEEEILRSNFGRFWEEEKSEESLTPYFEHSKIILQVSK